MSPCAPAPNRNPDRGLSRRRLNTGRLPFVLKSLQGSSTHHSSTEGRHVPAPVGGCCRPHCDRRTRFESEPPCSTAATRATPAPPSPPTARPPPRLPDARGAEPEHPCN